MKFGGNDVDDETRETKQLPATIATNKTEDLFDPKDNAAPKTSDMSVTIQLEEIPVNEQKNASGKEDKTTKLVADPNHNVFETPPANSGNEETSTQSVGTTRSPNRYQVGSVYISVRCRLSVFSNLLFETTSH